MNLVSLVILELNREYTLGIDIWQENKYILDYDKNKNNCNDATYITANILDLDKLNNDETVNFEEAARDITIINKVKQQQLLNMLHENASVFREKPSRISA